jgi:hypothetical protein
LDNDTARENYGAYYYSVFKTPVPTPASTPKGKKQPKPGLPTIPSAIDAIAGFAIDFVAAQLTQEATRYESQFKKTITGDEFWTLTDTAPQPITMLTTEKKIVITRQETADSIVASDKDQFDLKPPITRQTQLTNDTVSTTQLTHLVQNYWGFVITRNVKIADDPQALAFNLVVGIAPSQDQQMFRLAPLVFEEPYAKAKVLSDRWYTWLQPWTLPGKIIKVPGHTINSTTTITITAYWMDKAQQFQVKQLAGFSIPINGYDITNHPKLLPGKGLAAQSTAWLPSVPISTDAYGKAIGRGTFTISALVDEKDASNTQQYLEQAADLVKQEKPAIIQLIPSGKASSSSTNVKP